MKLAKEISLLDSNELLTLEGIPPETFEYRLSNRSALEWLIDQYLVSTDKRSGITDDPNTRSTPHPNPLPVRGGEGTEPNRPNGPEHIVRRCSGLKAPNVIAWAGASTASAGPGTRMVDFSGGLKGRNESQPLFPARNVPPLQGGDGFVSVRLGLRATRSTPGYYMAGFQPLK